jgi:hypothetical protein
VIAAKVAKPHRRPVGLFFFRLSKCALSPARNGLACAGSVMGREIVTERSRGQVQADIDRPSTRRCAGTGADAAVPQGLTFHSGSEETNAWPSAG